MDKRTRWFTLGWVGAMAVAIVLPCFLSDANYLNAWVISIMAAVVALFVLSIPRRILVDDQLLEIRCVVETTRIEIRDIASICKTTPDRYSRLWPVLGSYGFFGYYGYYFSFRRWEMVKVYATEWDNLVEIEDIYEDRYIVSCRDADGLIDAVMQAKLLQAGDPGQTDNE